MNRFLLLFLLFVCISSNSDELVYTRETVNSYLNSSEGIYVVVKVGGRIPYSEYREYLISQLDEHQIYSSWKGIEFKKTEEFLILKNYKGFGDVGGIINVASLSDYGLTKIGKKYFLFIRKNRGVLEYGACDVFSLEAIPSAMEKKLDDIISFIRNSTLTPCLFDVRYDDPESKE
ncbi:hypothetical protein FKG94_12855 [Exilibacterium tricleocarpae]|uniref:Uncharacterized protein n=1 Tax=Exilibacterium tricleocarpae TaxID=2591008 RepID=A0A545TNV2_9GAMM|nr:hypothetical protein [Exilibacterium tricleocarpae]TQV78900.1 hypothetical protein FKG94_12855 [Exilibacterium tricleocarpae]